MGDDETSRQSRLEKVFHERARPEEHAGTVRIQEREGLELLSTLREEFPLIQTPLIPRTHPHILLKRNQKGFISETVWGKSLPVSSLQMN
ncbi:hypothetical protein AAFF_G00170050 [Aldrovandia affinis]|uniref:Uncharacterized protein n=1 Tax=Aldrovandia affinis TaxID=143900 RepID=A0AAD7W7S8_9TELE|nr:hypothetical protein AAFF_G00170050 [Aldrovandia affinis]